MTLALRDYQERALAGIEAALEENQSTLCVMPTGTGKTILFAHAIERLSKTRACVLAHRRELIWQARDKIEACTGIRADVEMAEYRADTGLLYDRSRAVIATVQTMDAGRIEKFRPEDFDLLICDEAHHYVAESFRRTIEYFRRNKSLKVVGVTATPDRGDEAALGQVFQSVAFTYDLADAIADGWLVSMVSTPVYVDGLDYSKVRTTAGDLNQGDLAELLEAEEPCHKIAGPVFTITGDRKAIVFCVTVKHAERVAEILDRHEPGCARAVSAGTPDDVRADLFADFHAGKFRFLCNVGIATEGVDIPTASVIAIARPTKSRALYAQMCGRGTRPVVPDELNAAPDAAARRALIAASGKPTCEILDFVGNSGRHVLITPADILGGNYSDAVVDAAKKAMADSETSAMDILQELAKAEERLRQEKIAAEKRRIVKPDVHFRTASGSPFELFGIRPARMRGWDSGKVASEKQLAMLTRAGIATAGLDYSQVRQLIGVQVSRWKSGRCTYKQARVLGKFGYDVNASMADAKRIIDALAANKWQRPANVV